MTDDRGNPEPRPTQVRAERLCPVCSALVPLAFEVAPPIDRNQYLSVLPTDLTDCYAHQWTHDKDDD